MAEKTGSVMAGAGPQLIVSNPVQAALDALLSGKDPSTAVYGTPDAVSGEGAPMPDDDESADPMGDLAEGDGVGLGDGEESSEPEEGSEEAVAEETPPEVKPEDVEYINVTDETGKKRLKVDWNDRDAIKKQLSLLAGARKWQAERDRALSQLQEVKAKEDNIKAWDVIEAAWNQGREKAVIDVLAGKQGAAQEWLTGEIEKQAKYQQATPQEREFYDMQERMKAQASQIEETNKKMQEQTERASKAKQEAEQAELRTYATDAFMKVRFNGQLADAAAEQQLNEVIWSQALARIDAMPDGTAVTAQLMEKEFAAVADTFRKVVKQQVETGTKKAMDQKKEQAQVKLNVQAKTSTKPSTKAEDQFREDVKSGNIVDSLKALMMGKIKL
jgi:hypothetical protein